MSILKRCSQDRDKQLNDEEGACFVQPFGYILSVRKSKILLFVSDSGPSLFHHRDLNLMFVFYVMIH